MPHIKDKNLELGDQLSAAVFWCFFKKIVEKANGNFCSEELVIPDGVTLKSFMKSSSPQFSLSEVFQVEFTNSKMKAFLMSRFLSKPSTLIHHSTQLSARSFVLFLTSLIPKAAQKRWQSLFTGWSRSKKWKVAKQSAF